MKLCCLVKELFYKVIPSIYLLNPFSFFFSVTHCLCHLNLAVLKSIKDRTQEDLFQLLFTRSKKQLVLLCSRQKQETPCVESRISVCPDTSIPM